MAQFFLIIFAIFAFIISYLLGTGFWTSIGITIIVGVICLVLLIRVFARMGAHLPTDVDAPSNGGAQIEPPDSRRRGTVQRTFVEKVQNARVIIDYIDADKTKTQRTVDVKNFDFYVNRDGTTIIIDLNTYCELRNAPRKFNYRRIIEASDAETGETIPNLGAWLWARRIR